MVSKQLIPPMLPQFRGRIICAGLSHLAERRRTRVTLQISLEESQLQLLIELMGTWRRRKSGLRRMKALDLFPDLVVSKTVPIAWSLKTRGKRAYTTIDSTYVIQVRSHQIFLVIATYRDRTRTINRRQNSMIGCQRICQILKRLTYRMCSEAMVAECEKRINLNLGLRLRGPIYVILALGCSIHATRSAENVLLSLSRNFRLLCRSE